MILQREKRTGRFQSVVFIEQFLKRDPCIDVALYLLYNLAERVSRYRVAVSLQFARKVYISPVNMAAYLEIHDVHIGEVLIHHQTAIFYPYILLVDIGDFRQRFDTALFGQGVDVCGVLLGFGKDALCRCYKLVERHLSTVFRRGIDMNNLALVLGIPQASANLCEQRGNI